ncbi:MAG: glycine cleavage T C-terminal barrel domain-containing protein [Acidimicrobiia bacterium]|nr:glycine cleavage T C-terminal barrel domain-containing protein [Acidimicrobiia bacterium]
MSETWPESFGDVTAEYGAARTGAALVGPVHDLVWAVGSDAVSFLDGQLSQDVASVQPGGVVRSLLLEPRGKLTALLWLLRGEGRVGMLCDAGTGPAVVESLDRFRFRVDCELEIDARPVLGVWGPEAQVVTDAPDVGWVERDGVVLARVDVGGLDRVVVVGRGADDLVGDGAVRAGRLAATAVRVEAGEPVVGRDVDDGTIPQETGLVPESVSFTKGCFLGQELVARIDSRGRVNRHLRGVAVVDTVVPPEGATLHADDREVGTLTSVAESLTVMAPVGLALVRREVEPGDEVELRWEGGSARARVLRLPLDDFASA